MVKQVWVQAWPDILGDSSNFKSLRFLGDFFGFLLFRFGLFSKTL